MNWRPRLGWNAATRRRRGRRRRRRGRRATFSRTIRLAISPTLITHNDSPPVPITTISREGDSVPQLGLSRSMCPVESLVLPT